MNIILASTSPRRQELLKVAGVDFTVMAVHIDESWQAGESADDYIMRMVNEKFAKACQQLLQGQSLIITADTIGVLPDGRVLTKPANRSDAYAMWDQMSDTTHEVWTAVCVGVLSDGRVLYQQSMVCRTQVDFVKLTDAMKHAYWQTGEPADKAGAYAIQGGAMAWVKSIRGSYTNVVGLPLAQTLELIEQAKSAVSRP